ncbi:LapA family protein [Mycobacterium sp. ML4]
MTSNPPGALPPDQPHADQPAARRSAPAQSRPLPKDKASAFTRAGALWSSLIVGFLILILLLVFITQNTASTAFTFLGWHWTLPLGVAILLAAVVGGLITVAVGTARIVQLRRAAKKNLTAAVR